MGLAGTTGKPVTMEVGGRDLTFSPLTIDDFAEIEAAISDFRLAQFVKGAAKAQLEPKMIADGIAGIVKTPVTNEETTQYTSSMSGGRHLIYLSLRKNHPDVELNKVGEFIPDIEKLVDVISVISGVRGDEDKNPTVSPAEEKRSLTGSGISV